MAGGRAVNFEVYHMQGGRWQIAAQMSANQRDDAIEVAKELEKEPHIDATCVIREAYEKSSNRSTESIIYHTPSMKSKPAISQISGSKGDGKDAPPPGSAAAKAAEDYAKKEEEFMRRQEAEAQKKEAAQPKPAAQPVAKPAAAKPKKKGKKKANPAAGEDIDLMRIAMAFLMSSIAATIITAIAFMVVQGLKLHFGREITLGLLGAVFGLSFLSIFVPMLKKILAAAKPKQHQELHYLQESRPRRRKKKSGPTAAELAMEALEEHESTGPDADEKKDDKGAEDDIPAVPEPEEIMDPVPGATEGPMGPEPMAKELHRFVDEAWGVLGDRLKGDPYLRFGTTLFLAGASEPLSQYYRVGPQDKLKVLTDRVEGIGVEDQQARGFCANIEEYLLDNRYFNMYSAGRSGGNRRVTDKSAESGFKSAMKDWQKPEPSAGGNGKDQAQQDTVSAAEAGAAGAEGKAKPAEEETGRKFVAVLFTDIVNSTTKQQENGDEWMMNVVRAHNDIVRRALKDHGGREIKHTGDGIMASFPAVAESVSAAIEMQRGFLDFAGSMPDLAFEVRAGISAGEPIHESGDIFGTPVNLAARVMDKAGAGEIAVSSIVREMCRGKDFKFKQLGVFELKGFGEPQSIYHVSGGG